jgi:hypothetical protein
MSAGTTDNYEDLHFDMLTRTKILDNLTILQFGKLIKHIEL